MFTVRKSFLRAPLGPRLHPEHSQCDPQGNVDTPMRNSGPGAIFTRNHIRMLEYAVSAAGEDPKKLVTFRSAKKWKGARDLLKTGSEVLVYFAVVDHGPMVRFVARLREVLPAPDTKRAAAERLLLSAPPHTIGEDLWGGRVKALYAISGCRRVKPFPMTRLLKLENGEPLAENYKYSYVKVRVTPSLDDGHDVAASGPSKTASVVPGALGE